MPDPKLGDVVEFAGDEDVVIAAVVELGEPEHHEVLVQDRETGHRKWILNVDVEVIDPSRRATTRATGIRCAATTTEPHNQERTVRG